MSTFPIVTIIPQKIFVERQMSIIDYQSQNMTMCRKTFKTGGELSYSKEEEFGNISGGSSKTSIATEIKLIKR